MLWLANGIIVYKLRVKPRRKVFALGYSKYWALPLENGDPEVETSGS
jgi:hypothetical protein